MDPGVLMKKIVYTDPMTVSNQIIFSPDDGMCGGDNYLKREKKKLVFHILNDKMSSSSHGSPNAVTEITQITQ